MDIENEIDRMINLNKLSRFENELSNKKTDDDRKKKLGKIIENMKENLEKECKNEMDEYFDKLVANQYKKRWSSLSDELKRDRIKLYCEERKFDDNMINDINELYENGQLKGKRIEYDDGDGMILNIKI